MVTTNVSPIGQGRLDAMSVSDGSQRWFPNEGCSTVEQMVAPTRWRLIGWFHWRLYRDLTVGTLLVIIVGYSFLIGANIVVYSFDGDDAVESSGGPPQVLGFFAFQCVMHRLSVTRLVLGISLEHSLLLHKFFGFVMLVGGAWHGYLALEREYSNSFSNMINDDDGVSGILFLGSVVLLVVLSLDPIRRRFFNFFLWSHQVLAVVCVVAAALHSSTLVVFGGIAVACDMIYRYVIEPKRKQFPHNSKVSAVGDVVKISVPKGSVAYQGGQYFFINLPTVAKVEYHPISISSAPHEDNLTFHAKALGDWSKELLKQVQAGASMMPINIEGPLGSCTADIWSEKFQVFVLVAGGIGVTPLRSVCRQLMDQHTRGRPMVHIRFVWILRDETLVQAVGTLDTDDGQHRHGVLHPEYYFTRNRMPAGGLNGSVVEGRPDLSKIFHDVAEIGAAAGQSSVAVLNCGPHPMVSSSERIAAKVSSSKVYFTVHSELFDF